MDSVIVIILVPEYDPDPDTNYRDIDFRKNLIKPRVDRGDQYKYLQVMESWQFTRSGLDNDRKGRKLVLLCTGCRYLMCFWELNYQGESFPLINLARAVRESLIN